MSKTYETGHAKNVANFETLITYLTSYGAVYNPSNTKINLSSLNQKAESARFITKQVNELIATSSSAIAARAEAFEPLSKLSTKIFNALKASNLTASIIDNAATNHRKLQGRRATAILTEEQKQQLAASGTPVNQISASQQSFDSKLDSLDKQVQLLKTIPQYAPNETELKFETLVALQNDLLLKNRDVIFKNAELNNARLNRDKILYHPDHGMVALAVDAKNYSKSIFGTTTPQYKQISGISFRNIKM
ncbi:hypothetical protein EV200_104167 [Pedobacter psychrotolerans]|uniref:Uncharacterized protein n=1 Tax=Pedobacter psychrotolerans TaxID=1843235 RepID=A0A4R2HCY4_9SPHI|nr:hypothetical protein [Pedobacter psychrotolerans]TCO25131.1 hypothetical protein EV200_104167 [Pedobacter psychrotolerans]GGE47909.1 hypothetical protein GCM10011413_12450 [Pedobacter psychrotolerans]